MEFALNLRQDAQRGNIKNSDKLPESALLRRLNKSPGRPRRILPRQCGAQTLLIKDKLRNLAIYPNVAAMNFD
jgi:hypothetical protein